MYQLFLYMLKFISYLFFSQFFLLGLTAQSKMDKKLKKFNKESIPYISVETLKNSENVMLFDTRKKDEFSVSHLSNAVWVGYQEFDIKTIDAKVADKNSEIVVYCSIGVRSEDIGEKLQKAGYKNVKNLYGGIFEWKNKGFPVYDSTGRETEKVHAFSKHWGKLLTKGKKVYDTENR